MRDLAVSSAKVANPSGGSHRHRLGDGQIPISGATRLAGVIGDPVRHSLSPAIHNAAFRALGLDWIYLALPVAAGSGADAVAAMRTLGIDGLSVTMPHKAEVASACDRLTPTAAALKSCNTLYRQASPAGSVIVGHSTDGDGFVSAFQTEIDRSPGGLRYLIIGAGGAAASIVEALGRADAGEILIANRTAARAQEVSRLADSATHVDSGRLADATRHADVIVNTTSIGMTGGPDPTGVPVPVESLQAEQVVIDIVYNPLKTPLLAAAEACGARTANGLGMLIGQAAEQFVRWTGEPAPIEAMAAAVAKAQELTSTT